MKHLSYLYPTASLFSLLMPSLSTSVKHQSHVGQIFNSEIRISLHKDSKSADSNPMQSSQSTRSGNKVKIVGTRQTDSM